jgi:Clr5 domain
MPVGLCKNRPLTPLSGHNLQCPQPWILFVTTICFILLLNTMAPPKIDFEKHKDLLFGLYIDKGRILGDVKQYMKTIHSFEAR